MKELDRVKEDIADDEVERAKNKIASSLVLSGEVPLGRMRSIGGQWMYNREYRRLEQDMATLMSLNVGSLQQLMFEFPFDPMTIVTLGPGRTQVGWHRPLPFWTDGQYPPYEVN